MDEYLKKHHFDKLQIVMIKYKFGFYGSFFTNLIETILTADPVNRIRLSKGFPDEVAAVHEFQTKESWWTDTRQRFEKLQADAKAERAMREAGLGDPKSPPKGETSS